MGTYNVRPESVRINEPIDPRVFTFEGLDVRRGAHVFNHKTGEEYLYDDIPLHLKVALATAREREEELAEAAVPAPESPAPLPAAQGPAQGPQPTPPDPPGGGAAASTARILSDPPTRAAVEATSRDATPKATKSAQLPPETRPAATEPAAKVQPAHHDDVPPAPPTDRPTRPSTAATIVVVSAGCVAALGIGIWKLARRDTPRRAE